MALLLGQFANSIHKVRADRQIGNLYVRTR